MKVLILGVSGFIGRILFQYLSEHYEVYGASRTKVEFKNCYKLNLSDESETSDFFKNNRFDAIVNLASKMASAENQKDFDLLTENFEIQKNIIKALSHYHKCYFINFSSSAVYPNVTGSFSEGNPIDPSVNNDCLYGLAKFNSEVLFKYFFPENIDLVNLRIGYVYGDDMNPTRIHKVFEKELEKENKITVFSDGERVIPQIHVDSLSNVIAIFLENRITGIYNIADENISLLDLAKSIIKEKGNNSSRIEKISKGKNTKFRLDTTKLKKCLERCQTN